jgi:hypothetical protein
VDAGVAEPWDRGHGEVDVQWTAEAVAMLRLPAVYAQRPFSVHYYQGPILDRAYAGNYSAGALFMTEIHSKHPELTTGQMVGTPAMFKTTYGAGRVLISPPHPEETMPRLDDVLRAYTLWVGRSI